MRCIDMGGALLFVSEPLLSTLSYSDRRCESTFQDASGILFECSRGDQLYAKFVYHPDKGIVRFSGAANDGDWFELHSYQGILGPTY
jgi:hypothetical protein